MRHFAQTRNCDCGTACVKMVLDRYGRTAESLLDLLDQAGWPSDLDGTDARTVENLLRGPGRLGVASGSWTLEDLEYLTRTRPVICAIQHNKTGHWVVVVGVDLEFGTVTYLDPAGPSHPIATTVTDFDDRWCDVCGVTGTPLKNWGIVAFRM